MNSLPTKLLFLVFALTADLRAEVLHFRNEGNWEKVFPQMSSEVQDLILTIQATDMHPYLLSEFKNQRLHIMNISIFGDSLVVVDLEEGHASETVVFDRDGERGWTIIRRGPIGDWKPKDQRKGDRLTQIPFPVKAIDSKQAVKKP
jgi:hypothetical protein